MLALRSYWKAAVIFVQQIVLLVLISKLNHAAFEYDQHYHYHESLQLPPTKAERTAIANDRTSIRQPTRNDASADVLTLVGISRSDAATSDAAVDLVVEAACAHGARAHLLLDARDAAASLAARVAARVRHRHALATAAGGEGEGAPASACLARIRVAAAPPDDGRQ